MSTTTDKLKYLWTAVFKDGSQLDQPEDDRYSKHDDNAEWNPSAFRDIQEHPSEVQIFALRGADSAFYVNLETGEFATLNGLEANPIVYSLEQEPLKKRKLIYVREMQQHQVLGEDAGAPYVNRYIIGYEGKNSKNRVEKKVIYING